MTRPAPLFAAALILATSAFLMTACSTPAEDAGASQSPAPTPTSPEPTPQVTPSAAPVAEPKCDTIISSALIAEFEGVGWTVQAEPLRIGELEIPEGVQCVWGDFTVATDHVQIFGWAPIAAEQKTKAIDDLIALGWRREDTPEGVYVTESADTTVATDAEGYGLTYLFGDGWVKYADTKQGLLLVTWPPVS